MLTLLIIESDAEYATKIKEKIHALKHVQLDADILHATTLKQALELLKEESIDLIITNLFLSDASGKEIVIQLSEELRSLPILLCGKKITDPLADASIHIGAQDFFDLESTPNWLLARHIRYAIERQHLTDSLRALSFTDELTNIYNRRGFIALCEQQIDIAKRMKRGFFLYLMDVDYLKQINDSYGHQVGDQALQEIAHLIKSSFRRYDIVARIGGDEFAVLAVQAQESFGVEMKNKVLRHIEEHNKKEHKPYTLALSMGSAYYHPDEELTYEALFHKADKSLYLAKQQSHSKG